MKNKYLIIFIALFYTISNAQSDWKTKNIETWSKADVEIILNNSDWAKSQEIRIRDLDESLIDTRTQASLPVAASVGVLRESEINLINSRNAILLGATGTQIDYTFTLRLRSSMAIRLGLIRKNQLETDTTKLSKDELNLFNKKQRGLFDCPACKENYVLTLSSKSRENKNYDAVFNIFSNVKFDELKKYLFLLNEKGEKRELVNFVQPKVPGDEAIFFFSRFDDKGKPLFTVENKHLIFNSTSNSLKTATNFKVEIKPLIVGGNIDF
jgi:hypothetical protein